MSVNLSDLYTKWTELSKLSKLPYTNRNELEEIERKVGAILCSRMARCNCDKGPHVDHEHSCQSIKDEESFGTTVDDFVANNGAK